MNQKTVLMKLALTAVAMLAVVAPKAEATIFNEIGDAGDILPTAQNVGGGVNTIRGRILPYPSRDVDLYELFFDEGGVFTAEVLFFEGVDSELFFFDSQGFGILANDDVDGSLLSRLTTTIQAGTYYLGMGEWNI